MSTLKISESTKKGALLNSKRLKNLRSTTQGIVMLIFFLSISGILFGNHNELLIMFPALLATFLIVLTGEDNLLVRFIKNPTQDEIKDYLIKQKEIVGRKINQTEEYLTKLKKEQRVLTEESLANYEAVGESLN